MRKQWTSFLLPMTSWTICQILWNVEANPWSEIPDCVLEINNALPKQVVKRKAETSTTSKKM